ncbi:unknown [Salmonella phage FelixO1]|uniref:Uncharacterized protein n=1 Tax=Salmonella phage Felix O1 (isolate Felix O1-VT1) TaxID=1283336 RepID=Q6KGK5_BPFO1|nr:unknown [Salmonella phage FelixO1]
MDRATVYEAVNRGSNPLSCANLKRLFNEIFEVCFMDFLSFTRPNCSNPSSYLSTFRSSILQ